MNAAVTDTHALLFHSAGGRALGRRAAVQFQSAEQGTGLIYVPMAVLMEVAFLARAGRVGLSVRPGVFFKTLFANPAYQPLDLSTDQVLAAGELRFNRDPYDALIVAAAQSLDLPLMTRDAAIAESKSVRVLW